MTNFSIDIVTGELYLLVEQDYESTTELMVTVTIDDGQGLTATKVVTVMISDENDAPEFSTDSGTFAIEENMVSGVTALGRIGAEDEDGDTIVYRVSDSTNFSINNMGDLYLLVEQDYETVTQLMVTITIDDGEGLANSVVAKELVVNILDLDDTAPTISSNLEHMRLIDEGTQGVVGTVSAADVDTANSALIYSTGDTRFDIDVDGRLQVTVDTIDYETISNGRVQVLVTVSDGVRETMQNFDISILDVNDHAPMISSLVNDYQGRTIEEDAGRTKVGEILVTDGDGTAANRQNMFTTGDARFEVEANGDIYFTPEQISVETLDFTTMITVDDGKHTAVSESITIRVHNTDGIETLSILDQYFSVLENAVGSFTVRATAGAATGSIMYSIGSGNGDGFTITSGGTLSLTAKDYENLGTDKTFAVLVTATSGSDVESATITVTIQDANDVSPMFENTALINAMSIEEGLSGIVGTISASDEDTVGVLSYSTADTRFSIMTQGDLGILSAAAGQIDYEAANVMNGTTTVLVTVSDGDLSHNQTREYVVTVEDVNDHAPMILSIDLESGYVSGIDEGTAKSLIARVSSTDGDGTAVNKIFMYSTDSANFSVDAASGDVYFTAPTNIFESGGLEYIGTITVSDDAHTGEEDSEIVRITVLNTDGVYELVFADQEFTVLENTEGEFMLSASAGTASIVYSIGSGNTDGFTISGSNLLLTEQNYEVLLDKELSVMVTAESAGFREMATITVTVEDANDAPELSSEEYLVMENMGRIGVLVGTDEDGDDLIYSVSDSRYMITGNELFFVSGQEGDYEVERELEVLVTVRDDRVDSLSSSMSMKIYVTNETDEKVIGGLGFNTGLLYSWHDASIGSSFIDSSSDEVLEGSRVYRWLDQSGQGHHLQQTDVNLQGKYEEGVMRYELDGRTSYDYQGMAARATTDMGLSTFSVIKMRDLGSSSLTPFLFGHEGSDLGYSAGINPGEIFSIDSRIAEVQVDGQTRTIDTGIADAVWTQDISQIVYTRSDRNAGIEISRLSQYRDLTDRSIRGDISEVIIFNVELTDAQEVIINNYLSSKWGIGLSSSVDYYMMDMGLTSHKHELSGLLKLSTSDEVLFTNEFGGLWLRNSEVSGAISDAGDGFFVGHNGEEGLNRRWHSDFTDAIGTTGGTVDIVFSLGALGLSTSSSYELVFGDDLYTTGELEGTELKFAGVLAGDGVFYLREAGKLSLVSNVFSVSESELGIGTLEVYADVQGTLSYRVSNTSNFMVDLSTGELRLENLVNYETADELSLLVTLTDNARQEVVEVKVLVTDANDAPEFEMEEGDFMISEGEVSGVDALGTIIGTDEDMDELLYSVGDVRFSIDAMGGELYLLEAARSRDGRSIGGAGNDK